MSFLDSIVKVRVGPAGSSFRYNNTSDVSTRAETLGAWWAEQLTLGTLRPDDPIHLVGHSTGGLDIRELVWRLSRSGADDPWERLGVSGEEMRAQLRSVQFLSTPHRGTNLARWAHTLAPLPKVAARVLFLALHRLGPLFWTSVARFLRESRRGASPGWDRRSTTGSWPSSPWSAAPSASGPSSVRGC